MNIGYETHYHDHDIIWSKIVSQLVAFAVFPFSHCLVQSVNRNFVVEVKFACEFIRACPLQCLEQVRTGGRPQFALAASTATNWFPGGLTQEININSYRINSKRAHYAVTQTVMRPIV